MKLFCSHNLKEKFLVKTFLEEELGPSFLQNLEKLSRIDCKPSEEKEILESLQKIIGYMELLQEIDTEKVKPCNHVLGSLVQLKMRKDEIDSSFTQKAFLQNVPEVVAAMVKVPPVLKPEE